LIYNLGKHSKKKSKKLKEKMKLLIFILRLVLIIILIYSLINIAKWYLNNKTSAKIMNDVSKAIVVDVQNDGELTKNNYNIDFRALKQVNSDTVGFLKVNGTNIEYPVVKGNDNDFYLNHSFDKSSNLAGWIFADYKNKLDGTDKNIIIYGHNRRDGSMFFTLKNILNEAWYENKENLKVKFITEKENAQYEVFSVYQIEAESYYIQTTFKNNEEYLSFLETIKERSKKDFNIEVTAEDSILTLSTCANNNKYRVVLHAKKIK